jgi:uncharacterized Zn-finger protein
LQNNQQPDRNIDDNVKNNSTQSKKYPCTFEGCTSIFTRKETLDDHMLAHYNEQKYPCNDCNKKFNTKRRLKDHKKTNHGDTIFICHICDKIFTRKEYLNGHKKTESHIRKEKNNTATDYEPYRTNSAKIVRLIKHSQQYTVQTNNPNTSKKNPCTFKNHIQLFTTASTLKDHILLLKNQQNYPCNKCKNTFNTEKKLRLHEKHHEGRQFLCDTCNIPFKRKSHLKSHNTTQLHKRNINNILIDHSPYKPDPCITDDKNYSVEVAMKEQSILNHESQNIYQDNNKHDPSKLPDSAEPVIQEEDCLSDTEKYFNENNLLDIEIRPDEDVESLTAGLNYDKIVAHYL